MDYPYENLDPERFQQFCQALIAKEHPKVQCFPVGQPDGGRDALSWLAGSFVVFQVKFSRNPFAEVEPHNWLLDITKEEAPKVKKLIERGASNYYLITNIPGTAHPVSGSIDKMNQLLTSEIGIPSVCLWRDDLNRRLDTSWDLKWIYPELMTGPDLIRSIVESGLSQDQSRRSNALRAFLRDQYELDQQVRFKQVELQNKLLDLFIDVPISSRHPTAPQYHFLASLARTIPNAAGESETEPAYTYYSSDVSGERGRTVGAATMLLHPLGQERMNRVVLEGAPGQGKSTVVQYICQVHRMRILGKKQDAESIPPAHSSSPIRLPFKVDLRDLSTWLNKKNPFSPEEIGTPPQHWYKSLEAFLAAQIRHHSGGAEFTQDDLLAVTKISSVLLVLDGLDEVADIKRRQEVVDEIIKGVNRLEESSVSLQVVVTSRPAGFANSPGLPEDRFVYFQLDSVTRPLINEYANRWLEARRIEWRQASEFKRILKDKLDQPHLRDLARNPMQLAILLSLIHTRGSSLPDKRTALYDSYIELFFNRESEKSDTVRDHRDLLIDIHRYLAWTLHSDAEQGHDRGSINSDRLHGLVSQYLSREGHDVALAGELFTGMVERVVALVSRVQGTYEFEVQPLREYFAARYLYDTAPYSPPGNERRGTKPDRFDALARDFYWLNVVRFYGGCYSKGELTSLVDRLQELAKDKSYRNTSHPRVLAATLLSDWVFAQHPKSVREVVGLILDGSGLRFIVSSSNRRHGATPLTLPPRCGREELIQRCFELLRTRPARDYAFDILAVLKGNCSDAEIEKLWSDEVVSKSKEDLVTWLDYGLRLEVLPRLDIAKLRSVIGATVGRDVLQVLFRARRFDFIEEDAELIKSSIQLVLNRRVNLRIQRSDSVLEMFSYALDAARYAAAFKSRSPIALFELWETPHEVPRFAPLHLSDAIRVNDSIDLQQCVEVVRLAETLSRSTAVEWSSTLSPWSELVEQIRVIFGDQWVVYHIASLAAGIRSSQEGLKGYRDLLDASQPLCFRARYARLRSGNVDWWARQINSSQTEHDRMFSLLLVLTWGTINTVIKLADLLSGVLESLPTENWTQLAASLRESISTRYRYGGRYPKLAHLSLPSAMSARLAMILGLRAKETETTAIYERYLKAYDGSDAAVLDFCLAQNLKRSYRNKDWRPNLNLIRKCYSHGIISQRVGPAHIVRGWDPQALTDDFAEEIASNANLYPSWLVGLAEAKCRAVAGLKIVPVGQIASREEWFT